MRLDLYLVEKGLFESRNKAKLAIEANDIFVNGKVNNKSNYDVKENDIVEIGKTSNPYVSRGGLKLERAIKDFYLDFNDKVIVDIGSSTGGFTDCSLKHGARLVYAIDVGSNQLHESLVNNPKVVSMENTNILDVDSFPLSVDYLVMDVSFVSIEHLLPGISKHINDTNALVCLIKPQFEVGKTYMKNGIVKDSTVHINVIKKVSDELNKYGLGIKKLIQSPILGGSGNKEYLALIKRNVTGSINIIDVVRGEKC